MPASPLLSTPISCWHLLPLPPRADQYVTAHSPFSRKGSSKFAALFTRLRDADKVERKAAPSSSVTYFRPAFLSVVCRQKRLAVCDVTNRVGRLAKRKAMLCLVEKSVSDNSSSSSSLESSRRSKAIRSVTTCNLISFESIWVFFLEQLVRIGR